MSDLKILREGWDLIEQEELRLLRAMTVQESLDHWLQLQKAFEWQLTVPVVSPGWGIVNLWRICSSPF